MKKSGKLRKTEERDREDRARRERISRWPGAKGMGRTGRLNGMVGTVAALALAHVLVRVLVALGFKRLAAEVTPFHRSVWPYRNESFQAGSPRGIVLIFFSAL